MQTHTPSDRHQTIVTFVFKEVSCLLHLSHFTTQRPHNNKRVKGTSHSQSIAIDARSIALLKSDKQVDSLRLQTRSDADENQNESCRNNTLIHTLRDIHSWRTINKQTG
jgi:hypothetical protein